MIIHDICKTDFCCREKTVCVLGDFDGLHLAHRRLLDMALALAAELSAAPAAFTFAQNSKTVFDPSLPLLGTQSEKEAALAACGMRYVFSVPFEQVRMLDGETFFREILLGRCNACGVVCGFNFRFGKGASATADTLTALCKDAGIACRILPPVLQNGENISSSRIRALLMQGAVEEASALLGSPYSLRGIVSHGAHLGHVLGFPTANIPLPPHRVIPADGVYITRVFVDETFYPAVTDIGCKPTVSQGAEKICESHLLAPGADLYGREITVSFLARIRDEQRFPNAEALGSRIALDVAAAKRYFEAHPAVLL